MIISISNQKGGVGKTTTAINIAGGLIQHDKSVLLIDADPQANLTSGLLPELPEKHIYHLMTGKATLKEEVQERSEGLYILPSGIETAGLTMELSSQAGREYILQEAIQQDIPYLILLYALIQLYQKHLSNIKQYKNMIALAMELKTIQV